MKTYLLFLSLLISTNISFAISLTGNDLSPAILASIEEGKLELEDEQVLAFESRLVNDEVEVRILTKSDKNFLFGCHIHGTNFDCHSEDFKQGSASYDFDQETSLNYLLEGKKAALLKLEKTLKTKNLDLHSLILLKSWLPQDEGHSHDHEHSADVWVKANYLDKKGKNVGVFIQCHQHTGETDFACHYKSKAVSEYNFSL